MPALDIISFVRTEKRNAPINIIGALLLIWIIILKSEKKDVWAVVRDLLNAHLGREAFPGQGWVTYHTLWTYSKHHQSLDTPTCYVSTESFITLKMIIRLTSLPSPLAFWPQCCGTEALGMLTELWEALWPPGCLLDCSQHLLPVLMAPSRSSHL